MSRNNDRLIQRERRVRVSFDLDTFGTATQEEASVEDAINRLRVAGFKVSNHTTRHFKRENVRDS